MQLGVGERNGRLESREGEQMLGVGGCVGKTHWHAAVTFQSAGLLWEALPSLPLFLPCPLLTGFQVAHASKLTT